MTSSKSTRSAADSGARRRAGRHPSGHDSRPEPTPVTEPDRVRLPASGGSLLPTTQPVRPHKVTTNMNLHALRAAGLALVLPRRRRVRFRRRGTDRLALLGPDDIRRIQHAVLRLVHLAVPGDRQPGREYAIGDEQGPRRCGQGRRRPGCRRGGGGDDDRARVGSNPGRCGRPMAANGRGHGPDGPLDRCVRGADDGQEDPCSYARFARAPLQGLRAGRRPRGVGRRRRWRRLDGPSVWRLTTALRGVLGGRSRGADGPSGRSPSAGSWVTA